MLGRARQAIPLVLLACVVLFFVNEIWRGTKNAHQPSHHYGANQTRNEYQANNIFSAWWNWTTDDPVAFYTSILSLLTAVLVGVSFIQIRFLTLAEITARRAAIAARRSANAARKSAEHIPRVERAYVFLGMEVTSEIIAINSVNGKKSKVSFGLKNHGKTPAAIHELHVMADFWGAGWPAMVTAIKMEIQKGWMISAGETQDGYSTEFPLHSEQIERARTGKGYILFWGKVAYRDVFGESHESGWCRAYHFESGGWRFAGDETLNYYT
jgi:hypothetical protein